VSYRFLSSVTVLLAVVFFPGPATSCGGDGKVKVTLVVILASEEGNTIDPKLAAIAKEVQQLNPGLKSFRLKTMTSRSLAPGEKSNFPLIDDKTAQVIVQHGADKNNKVALAIIPPDQGEIVYRTVCGKFLPIVTRCQTKGKERLILAVRVQPCQGD
jgi:hypothetical protein